MFGGGGGGGGGGVGGPNATAPDGQSQPNTTTTTTTNVTTTSTRSSQAQIFNTTDMATSTKILQPPQQQQQQQQPATAASSSSSSSSGGGVGAGSPNDRPEKISFHLKSGIFTRRITIDSDKMALGLIKQLAIAFLNEIYFQQSYPANTYIGDYIRRHYNNNDNLNLLYERILLRKYNSQEGTFQPFNSVADITQESFISIEISERHQHLLSSSPQTNCTHLSHSSSSSCSHSPGSTTTTQSNYRLKISHDFHPETYFIPTHCASCTFLIKGVYKQGFQCNHCKKNYCPKCKVRAETTGEGCLALTPTTSGTGSSYNLSSATIMSTTPTSSGGLLSPPLVSSQNQFDGDNNNNNNININQANSEASGANNNSQSNGQCNNNNSDTASKSDHMSKRKSASNLLHFNIANPFKSHHGQQSSSQSGQHQLQQQSSKDEKASSKSVRGSAGALDPVLQQLSKQMRDQQIQQQQQQQQLQQQQQQRTNNQDDDSGGGSQQSANLLGVHVAQLSSSHQNLYTINSRDSASSRTAAETGSSSVHHSPSKATVSQLSNSARASTRDLLHATSPTRRDQATSHVFISMDWIQLAAEASCGVCSKPLKPQQQPGNQQQPPAMCKICKLQVHCQCQNLAPTDCLSRVTESSRAAAERVDSINQPGGEMGADNKAGLKGTSSNVSRDNIRLHRLAPSVKHIKRPDSSKPIIEGWLQHKTLSDEQSRKHYWRLDDTGITLYENDISTRYFKAIALSNITRVISASSLPKRIKEDVLLSDQTNRQGSAKSANSSPAKSSEFRDQMNAMFGFEVGNGSVYLVQACDSAEASRWKGSLEAITSKLAVDRVSKARQEEEAVASAGGGGGGGSDKQGAADRGQKEQPQQGDQNNEIIKGQQQEVVTPKTQPALPVPPTTVAGPVGTPPAVQIVADRQRQTGGGHPQQQQHHQQQQRHHHHHPASNYRGSHKTYTDPSRSRLYNRPRIKITLDPMSIPDHWIEGKYLIERDRIKGVGFEELGSGQFGKVYAAISEIKADDPSKGLWSGVPVAIKEISKARFDLRQQAKLKNEANILSRLDHPGVIILERVHDLHDKIYIVMEQLEDDMLEMIVSTPEKRLNERITKFLTYQILEALKYLHAQNIAHCDLKPENVLLVEKRCQFPQIKLCDFGFAKIIEENSFRSSLVGTPAYLAPEVVKGERYNRSVDLWSVGVIVYVSLSGEFPFNEGENIHDQISRANFMYPDQPWAKISTQAKNFINSLLRVNSDKRLSASRAQMDDWIQDYQLWCDLCELEVRIGKRWVTDDADFERWSRYARERGLQVPRSATLLHEQLVGD